METTSVRLFARDGFYRFDTDGIAEELPEPDRGFGPKYQPVADFDGRRVVFVQGRAPRTKDKLDEGGMEFGRDQDVRIRFRDVVRIFKAWLLGVFGHRGPRVRRWKSIGPRESWS